MRLRLAFALLCLLPASAHAVEVRKGQGTPAPTQPVTSNNLASPVFQSDTRNLEAILDKEENARVTRDAVKTKAPAPAAPLVTVPAAAPAETAPAPEEQGLFAAIGTAIRVFAIRWRDLIDVFFTMVLAFYMRKLYTLSRDQHKILSHSIRSAEYSAAAAKRSADICELLLKSQEKADEAQGKLDL